jgi:hypothetical protein
MMEKCYVQKIELKESVEPTRIVFYDFECTTDQAVNRLDQSAGTLHQVNMVGAYLCCTRCMDDGSWEMADSTGNCKHCGPFLKREWYWSAADHANPLEMFLDWLLHFHNPDTKTIAFAHYGGRRSLLSSLLNLPLHTALGRYDMHLLVGEMYRQGGLCPEILKSGQKMYKMTLRKKKGIMPETIFKDSYNLLPIKLSKIPSALGLKVEDKGYFPHLFNKPENMRTQLPNLPPMESYNPDGMKEEEAINFYYYYYVNARLKKTPFLLSEALVEYCLQDVRILAHGCVKLRDLFKQISGDDMLVNSVTAASACLRHFCINHLKEGEVAIIPELGAQRMDRQSDKALRYLKWVAFNESLSVQHRDSSEGEFRLYRDNGRPPLKLDGYVNRSAPGRSGQRDLCLEFNGRVLCSFCAFAPFAQVVLGTAAPAPTTMTTFARMGRRQRSTAKSTRCVGRR